MASSGGKGNCFIICPIGEDGTDTRQRSDDILECVLKPALEECGYNPVRAERIARPGQITTQIIEHLIEDPLVIADLTERNPNVAYELGIRHAYRKPCIHIIEEGEQLPFDLSQSRTIRVSARRLRRVKPSIEAIVKQIEEIEKEPEKADNPVSHSALVLSLKTATEPSERALGEVVAKLDEMRRQLNNIDYELKRSLLDASSLRLRDLFLPDRILPPIDLGPIEPITTWRHEYHIPPRPAQKRRAEEDKEWEKC